MEGKEFSQAITDKFNETKIDAVAKLMQQQIEVKDRRHRFTTYPACFIGTEMVTWIIENGYAQNVDEAIEVGDFFISKSVFHHVLRDHTLQNKNLFYRFEVNERSRGTADPSDSWSNVLEDREGDVLTSEELNVLLASISDWPKKNPELPEMLIDKHNMVTLDNCRPLNWKDPDIDSKYDLIAIGGGAGGLVSSIGWAIVGGKAAIIEKNIMGGDCLNTGCVPSKAFIKAAKVAHTVKNSAKYGVFVSDFKIDFGKVMERMREVRAEISPHDSVYKLAKQYGIDVFLGNATFMNPHEIDVNGRMIQFAKWCIATGGHPFIPDVEGLPEFPYLTNENIFNLTQQPKTLVIIGSGPIGWELGQSFARFGTKVIMLERGNQFLPKEDPDAAAYLHQQMKDDGVEIYFNTTPKKVITTKHPGKVWGPHAEYEFEVERNGEIEVIKGDAILVATGRRPNVHHMGLKEAGVEFDDRTGIKVDDYCRTTNKNIYAAGDVCSKYQFTHNSDHMARNVVRNALFFGSEKTSALIMSWCTYTDPEIAHVGKYPHDLDEEGIAYDTYKYDYAHNDRAICDSVTGIIKIHCKKGTDTIIGCTIVGGPAGDMICNIATAMFNKVGLKTLGTVVHPYPTYAEAFKALTGQINLQKLGSNTKAALRTLLKVKR